MTEKRFEIYDEENGYMRDNNTGKSYSACGGGDGFPFIIDEYHKLQKENEQLKQLVNIADDLIDKLGSETMQNEWIKNF